MHTPFRSGLQPVFNFFNLAVVPGMLLFAAGATRSSLGLTRPAHGTARALFLCLLVPIGICTVALWRGGITPVGLGWLLLHNTLSNGFSEEFFTRGMLFSQLRSAFSDEWSLVLQSLLFALLHLGGSLGDERTFVLVVANIVALNAPIGFVLGVMALRSRSLVLPSIVHVSLDTMGRLVGTQ